jgi:hypothetical protein
MWVGGASGKDEVMYYTDPELGVSEFAKAFWRASVFAAFLVTGFFIALSCIS